MTDPLNVARELFMANGGQYLKAGAAFDAGFRAARSAASVAPSGPKPEAVRPTNGEEIRNLVNTIKQALPMTMRNEHPHPARAALPRLEFLATRASAVEPGELERVALETSVEEHRVNGAHKILSTVAGTGAADSEWTPTIRAELLRCKNAALDRLLAFRADEAERSRRAER